MSKETKRIMFAFWDGGRGHLTRVAALATEAHGRGHEVGFVTSDKYASELGALAIQPAVFSIANRPPAPKPMKGQFPVYSHAFLHAQRLRGLGFDDSRWLKAITQQEKRALEEFSPHVVVNDYRDTIRTAAEATAIPVVGITQTTGNVHGKTLGNWVTPPPDAQLPDCKDSFNEVRAYYGLAPITDERYMFSGDINIIPSSPSLDPVDDPHSFHVGMLSKWSRGDGSFKAIDANVAQHRIFSYVGESTRPTYGYENILGAVIQQHPEQGFYVVGDPRDYSSSHLEVRQESGSLVVAPFISGPEATEDSSVILTHGGHSTVALALGLGRPIIGIGAFQSEAATTLRSVEGHGAGLYIPHSSQPLERRPSLHDGEDWEMFGHWQTTIQPDDVSQAIDKVLHDNTYRHKAVQLGQELLDLGGVEYALDIILGQAA